MKTFNDYKNEVVDLHNRISVLEIELSDSQNKIKELKETNYKEISHNNTLINRIKELEQTLQGQDIKINNLIKDIDNLNKHNQLITRIIKERATAARNIHPKKEHSGYLLISSNPIDYRYTLNGAHKVDKIYQTILRSPYSYDFNYETAYKQIKIDISHENNNGFHILRELGAKHFAPNSKYEQLMERDIPDLRDKRQLELEDEFNAINGYSPYGEDKEELRLAVENEELYYFFNLDIRWNGKEDLGYWEATLQSTCPIQKIPAEIRYKKHEKK